MIGQKKPTNKDAPEIISIIIDYLDPPYDTDNLTSSLDITAEI